MSSHSCGSITNQTVSAKKTTSAPTLRMFLPGSISGVDLMRAESLRLATIEPVNVTAPMKTPMNDLGGVDAEQALAAQLSGFGTVGRPRRAGSRSSRPAPRPGRRSECSSAISSGMPVISTTSGAPQPDRGTDRHRADQQARPSGSMWRPAPARWWRSSATAMPAMPKVLPGPRCLVLGQPGQRQDEQQGRDDVGRGGGGCRLTASAPR